MDKLPDVLKCIAGAPVGALSRDGQTVLFYGWCEFGWDAMNILVATAATALEVACCATTGVATAGVSCFACATTLEATKGVASIHASAGRSECSGPDPRDARIQELEEWRDAEIKRRLDAEDEKAWEEYQQEQKEKEEEEKAKMGT